MKKQGGSKERKIGAKQFLNETCTDVDCVVAKKRNFCEHTTGKGGPNILS